MLLRLWHHLSRRRQTQLFLIQGLIIVASVFEMLSLGAVIPFLSVLSDPGLVYESEYIAPFISFFEISEPSQLALPISLTFVALILLSAAVRLLLLYGTIRLGQITGADLSINIYRHTLYQDYQIHVGRNSSEVINGIITKTATVTKGVIGPILNLISSVVTIVAIVYVLVLVSPFVTFIAVAGFGGLYIVVMYITRRHLRENSQLIADKSDLMVRSLQEGLESIREVLINNNQQFYTALYENSDLQMRRASWNNEVIYASPRLGMEAVGISVIAIVAYFATANADGLEQFIPTIGAFVLGAQKLLPAIQKAYASYSRVVGSRYSLRDVIELLDQPIPESAIVPARNPIQFNNSIELNNLSFRYSKDSPWILKDVNLEIAKGSVVGVIGATGCGKTTLLDIIMGLLPPSGGELFVDNQKIESENKRAWQAHISNVPQHIYLSDGTIEENIAFGIPAEQIDTLKVQRAARQAQIGKLLDDWDGGYQTLVGERGMRLSGGQRQRIGIARAFYKETDLLVLDEATSALDDETELAVMDAIGKFDGSMTVIIIAHRLSTLRSCDKIVRLGDDYLTQILTYEEVMKLKNSKGNIDVD